MRSLIVFAAAAIAAAPFAAQAQEAAPAAPAAEAAPAAAAAPLTVKRGSTLRTADNKLLGKIDRITTEKDGAISFVSVIYDGRFVYVPGSTLSANGNGVQTSLTRAEATKQK